MPMITLQVAAEPDDAVARALVRSVTGLTTEILGKDPNVTAIAIEFVPRDRWFIAGRTAEELGKAVFFLDVRITDGTNNKEQKARYIAEVFAAIDALLGGVHEESYVHVDDARADAYGYGGRTQERRFVERNAVPASRGA